MKHRVTGKRLNRSTKHRKALFKNLAAALIQHGTIETTQTKAKIIKRHIDKHITLAKKGTLHSRRLIQAFFNQKQTTNRLVDVIAPSFSNRTSGYTRITPLGNRRGDDTPMVRIEFVDPIIETEEVKSASKTKSTAIKKGNKDSEQ